MAIINTNIDVFPAQKKLSHHLYARHLRHAFLHLEYMHMSMYYT